MGKKLTYEEVRSYIENPDYGGYKLLSTKYKDNKTKLQIKCPESHIISSAFNNFQQGYRCGECNGIKKLTYEYVKEYIENPEFGRYKLLSTEYKNSKTILEIECPFGHRCDKLFHHFKDGKRCAKCSGIEKLTYEYVKEYIENPEFGRYKLLSTEYKNSKTILEIECSLGHRCDKLFHNFKDGQRCAKCSGVEKLTYEYVKEYIENPDLGGYKLLSIEYTNNHSTLEIECPLGHRCDKNWNSFFSGNRCIICSENNIYTIEEVKEFIENPDFGGYKLLSTEYINTKSKLHIECPFGHRCDKSFHSFKRQEIRCAECAECKKYSIEEIKIYIEKLEFGGYKLLSAEYKDNKEKIQFECPKNHIFDMAFSNFKNMGQRCPMCKNKTETKLLEWLETKYEVTYQPKYEWCKKERKLPYDFAIEEYKILIELDGDQHFRDFDHWDSNYKEVQSNDKFKMLKALQKGYSIIRIYQPDVLNDTIDWKTITQELITLRNEWRLMYISSKDIYDDEECDFNFNLAKNDITELEEVDGIIHKIDNFHLEEVDNDTKTIKIEDFKNKIANIKSILIKGEKNYICYFKGRVSL